MRDRFLRFMEGYEGLADLIGLRGGWSSAIPKKVRFVLLMIFSFFTYTTFKALGGLSMDQINELMARFISDPGFFLLALYITFWSAFGLYFSLITAALVASLVPKP